MNSINISSKSIFIRFMNRYSPKSEICPVCQAKGRFSVHSYYNRSIIDFTSGQRIKDNICIMRVKCAHCHHTHAILPDIIIPYASYGIHFILQVLLLYFSHIHTIEKICEYFSISQNLLFKWISLFQKHKQEWLGLSIDSKISCYDFCTTLMNQDIFSDFLESFTQKFQIPFLQKHRNPTLHRYLNSC